MNNSGDRTSGCSLERGQRLSREDCARLWRVESGLMCVDIDADGSAPESVRLALPGDLIGIDALCGSSSRLSCRALTQCQLRLVSANSPPQHMALLIECLTQTHQRATEFVGLRSGPVSERVRRLLLLMGAANGAREGSLSSVPVPRLADMAEVLDSTSESVSRVFGGLQRLSLLQNRKPRSVGIRYAELRDVVLARCMTIGAKAC